MRALTLRMLLPVCLLWQTLSAAQPATTTAAQQSGTQARADQGLDRYRVSRDWRRPSCLLRQHGMAVTTVAKQLQPSG